VKCLFNEREQKQGFKMTREDKFELMDAANFKYNEKQVQSELRRLNKTINHKMVTYMFYVWHKIAAHLISGLHINVDGIE
jgi:hypothetical protein